MGRLSRQQVDELRRFAIFNHVFLLMGPNSGIRTGFHEGVVGKFRVWVGLELISRLTPSILLLKKDANPSHSSAERS